MFNFLKKGAKEVAKNKPSGNINSINNNINSNAMNPGIDDALDALNRDMMERNNQLADMIAKNQLG